MDKTKLKNIYSRCLYSALTIGLFILNYSALCAQTKYRTSEGTVNFNASTPLEDIDATNKEVNAILEMETGRFAVVMLIKDFEFSRRLMQEHFNENYMESEKFPKAYFSGTIEDFSMDSLSKEVVVKTVSGKLTIHGITLNRKEKIKLRKKGSAIHLESNFLVRTEAHDIEVPRIVFAKIAEKVMVEVDLQLVRPQ